MSGKPESGAAYTHTLSVNQLSVDVHLGISAEERRTPQKVVFDIRFYLPAAMSASHDDNGEYLCYHGVSEKVYALCTSKEYRLIEYLCEEVYRLIRASTPSQVKLWVRLQKPRILLAYVEEGSSFTTSDLPPFSWVVPS